MILDCYHTSLLPFPAHLSITRTQVASDDPHSDVYYFVNPYSGGCAIKSSNGDVVSINATHLVLHRSTGAWALWYKFISSNSRRGAPMRQLLGCRVEEVK